MVSTTILRPVEVIGVYINKVYCESESQRSKRIEIILKGILKWMRENIGESLVNSSSLCKRRIPQFYVLGVESFYKKGNQKKFMSAMLRKR